VGEPDQVPVVAVRVWPICALPLIWGSVVLLGTLMGSVSGPAAALLAVAAPALLLAVTRARIRSPWKVLLSWKVVLVAPLTSSQVVPASREYCHC
jgi:hypothetical protein